ncbi:MAG: glycosyltransferase family 39 protein [Dehalococcoidales bacterium]|nr:glycosyltransferase family 39 protein [Dehalococcoidales bacterium]
MSAKKISQKNKETTNPTKTSVFEWVKNHPTLLLLALITALAIFLRFFTLGSESIWLDEAYSIIESHLSVQGIAASSNHPPLYFWILRVWIDIFGTSEFAIRSLSAIFGVFTIIPIYFTGKTLFNKRIGLLSAFLASFGVTLIYYSQDARAYSLLVLLSTLSYLFFIKIFNTDEKKYYIAYTVVTVLLIYTHFFSLFLIGAQILFYLIFIKKYPGLKIKHLIPLAIIIVSIIPMLLLLKDNINRIGGGGFWITEPSNTAFFNTLINFSATGSTRYVVFAIFIILAIWGIISLFRNTNKPCRKNPKYNKNKAHNIIEEECPGLGSTPTMVLLLLWLFIPTLIPFIESKLLVPIFQTKYVVGAYPALVIMVAAGISYLRSKWLIYPVLILIIILSSVGLYSYYKYPNREQWREAVRYIETHSQPDDLIIICKGHYHLPFDYYYKGSLTEQGIRSTEDATDFINSEDGQDLKNQGRLWLVLAYDESDVYYVFENAYGKDSIEDGRGYLAVTVILFNPSGN